MDLVTFNYVVRMIVVGLDLIMNGLLIYQATMHSPPDKAKVIGYFIGGVVCSAALVFMALNPPE